MKNGTTKKKNVVSPHKSTSKTLHRREDHDGGAFPIVGVGASAGGLEAFTELLKHLPLDTGMAFVLVQHLDPHHASALVQLLTRATKLPVREVTDKLRVEPNCIYVIPPNTSIVISKRVLKLEPRDRAPTPHRPIDQFFESLAEDQRDRAIGVVLSGSATDGTLGIEAVKAEGGISFAQDSSARYESMPRSAVAAGCVDFVLSPKGIAEELARIAKHPLVSARRGAIRTHAESGRAAASADDRDDSAAPTNLRGPPRTSRTRPRVAAKNGQPAPPGRNDAESLRNILLLLRDHGGADFSQYKPGTIQRRISRRMILGEQATIEAYEKFLRGNAAELNALYSDVLISVTSFFRNPHAFDVLRRKVFPKLLQERTEQPIRVWVLGCSMGQEAYSIAMTFLEAAEKSPGTRKLQVFATDLNDALLDKARHGVYPKSLAQEMTPERLRRFFVEDDGGYRVKKSLRAMIAFARQNLLVDPPFSRMDVISCRNVLIYFEASLQKRAIPIFHYALNPHGFLFLGASESIGEFEDLFDEVDGKLRIYSKKAALGHAFQLSAKKGRGEKSAPVRARRAAAGAVPGMAPASPPAEITAQREADRISIDQFAPPGVLIDSDMQILQFRGPTGAYLESPTGKASFDVLRMARKGLMLPLRAAIDKAKKENKTVRKQSVRIGPSGRSRTVNLCVMPLKNLRERCFLILFEDAEQGPRAARELALSPALPAGRTDRSRRVGESRRVADLETELAETRDYLQSIQEQYEAANEELQASSEEIQSANEELQSINEELETSKEELESANEELTTVNDEMANRNSELGRLNTDLLNVQTSSRLAIVMLGRDLTVRRFSAQAEKQFNILASDIGRPFGRVRHDFAGADLESFVADVIATGLERQREVQDQHGRWFSLRACPYLTLDNKPDGAVLVLVDIDDLKKTERGIAEARDYAENVIATVREPLLVLDDRLRVESANRAFFETFRVARARTIGKFIFDLGNRQWDIPRLRQLLEGVLPQSGERVDDFLVEHEFNHLGKRTMALSARRVRGMQGQNERILLAIDDITERTRVLDVLREADQRLRFVMDTMPQKIFTARPTGDVDYFNPQWSEFTGLPFEEIRGWGWRQFIHPEDLEENLRVWQESIDSGAPFEFQHRFRRADGEYRGHFTRALPMRDADGKTVMWVGSSTDVHEQRTTANQLQQYATDLTEADRRKTEFLAMLAHELRNPLAPIRNALEIMRLTHGESEAVKSASQMMERQTNHMVRLVDDLLDVSRINQGKIGLRMAPVELASVVNHAVEAARVQCASLAIELSVTLPRRPIYLNADPARLAQVFGNLLNNACKFTERGGLIALTVEREGDDAVIHVRDNGIGMKAEHIPHIFDLFVQLDTSLERSVGGLGIGLTLVKSLVELHRGTVDVHSAGAGAGSEFVVRLPVTAEAPEAPPPPQEVPQATVSGLRILVVDDNRDAAVSLGMLLNMSGNQTHIAYDGLEALEAAAVFRPDVVLLDIGLPSLNGYEVARRMRELPGGAALVIVALTGWGQDEDRQRSADAGFDGHLVKPLEYAVLMTMLAESGSSRRVQTPEL
ncbi:MAG: CheR family methyltransferase [bacterium]